MRWLQLTILGIALAGPAQAEDIIDVLRRSQQQRLESMSVAPDGPRAQAVRRSFELLRTALNVEVPVQLLVTTGATMAETLHGTTIVANAALGDWPEGERIFVLAHEFGHVVGGHWRQMGSLYKRWVPGEVTRDKTDPVAPSLGRDASGLAHRQEYEADAFALQLLNKLGRSPQDAYSTFLRQGVTHDTATHPATRKRWAALRAMQANDAAP